MNTKQIDDLIFHIAKVIVVGLSFAMGGASLADAFAYIDMHPMVFGAIIGTAAAIATHWVIVSLRSGEVAGGFFPFGGSVSRANVPSSTPVQLVLNCANVQAALDLLKTAQQNQWVVNSPAMA